MNISIILIQLALSMLVTVADSSDEKSTVLEKRLEEMEARLANLERQNSKRGLSKDRRAAGNVAFTAIYTPNTDHHGIGEIVKLNSVLTNYGSGYNPSSGIFTAPHSGVYFFIYHFAHLPAVGQVWLQLTHDGRMVNQAASDVFFKNQDVQGGNSAILYLHAGDRMWLEYSHQSDTGLYGSKRYTTFSGILLF